ncbi:MAG: bifunctional phosphoribosylaminoimidazolecarboxamide formyltransferase/IMP cyclohydrolase [Gammaproteobacteria bacterium]|nr:bifunctional phosphoribosylaminoimidazolecarboxamide formyltransferase/IMP cyclohydrolase [Gammaproteobacteria bacterium]NND60317.1 bifunctional phosphoribosylaminoimidazolecarboxamide formyltransferase/IMP cyclohydrolase [Gammaproteobacteria bacterium]
MRALLSVSDKTGIVEFARSLEAQGVEILSTGGTAALLRRHDIDALDVAQYTGFPEIMEGRVKTLHPRIHAGLLARPGVDDPVLAEFDIERIDLLVVNLYPFEQTIEDPHCSLELAIENIDIGGPAMIRAAAKNYRAVAVATEPADYGDILTAIKAGGIDDDLRYRLAAKAFGHTSAYDAAITGYLHQRLELPGEQRFAATRALSLRDCQPLRYGENPHQAAALYIHDRGKEACIADAELLQGKAMSYNNIADADTALECVRQFYEPACVIVKHANPCGVAVDDDCLAAYRRAHSADSTSAFGGIIALNRSLDGATAEAILGQFVEVIIVPEVQDDAKKLLARKRNIRVLVTGWWDMERVGSVEYRSVNGGLLAQERDIALVNPQDLNVVSQRSPTEHELRDLLFAWKVCKFVKSNAIVFAKDLMTIGIGAGQTSRVHSARLGTIKAADAGLAVKGSVMASDAFFPFRDSIEAAAEHEVIAVIQPGGSKRDNEVIAAVDEHQMSMVFTGMRHFRH